jgi:hypothetical protein
MNRDTFTLEDIHQIRYANFEKTKHMTPEDLIENTRKQAETGKKMLEVIRNKTKNVSGQ